MILFELVAAGVEGGSKRAILEDWDLPEIVRLREHWAEYGPPIHIALATLASGWGMTLTASPSLRSSSDDPLQGLGHLPMARLERPQLGLPAAQS